MVIIKGVEVYEDISLVLDAYDLTDEDVRKFCIISDKDKNSEDDFTKLNSFDDYLHFPEKVVFYFEELIYYLLKKDIAPLEYINAHIHLLSDKIVVLRDIGKIIDKENKFDRIWLENCMRTHNFLRSKSREIRKFLSETPVNIEDVVHEDSIGKPYNRRGLSIIPINQTTNIITACRACGSVGEKETDVVKLNPYDVGKFTARATLLKLICARATPLVINTGIACEFHPTGSKIINGIEDEIKESGFQIVLNNSTEEDYTTYETGLGVTAIGKVQSSKLINKNFEQDNLIFVLGKPTTCSRVDLDDNSCYEKLKTILSYEDIFEVLPVGSRGILYELRELESTHKCKFKKFNITDKFLDLKASAGPVTSIVGVGSLETIHEILALDIDDFFVLGKFEF